MYSEKYTCVFVLDGSILSVYSFFMTDDSDGRDKRDRFRAWLSAHIRRVGATRAALDVGVTRPTLSSLLTGTARSSTFTRAMAAGRIVMADEVAAARETIARYERKDPT